MIVVDTNLIAYVMLGGVGHEEAAAVLQQDPEWLAPPLWRSEWTNVLATHVRRGGATADDGVWLLDRAEELVGEEHRPDAHAVLQLALASGCSASDCEFVAVAVESGLPLVTADREVQRRFPDVAVAPRAFSA